MFFPSKILLFGEYSLIFGGSGFAIPFEKFGGKLMSKNIKPVQGDLYSSGQTESNHSISKLCEHMKNEKNKYHFMNLDKLFSDVDDGLWFASSIPNGYGVGSSGALVAALYRSYATNLNIETGKTKERLASIESYFHGSSSGVDPMVAFYQQPLLIHRDGTVELMQDWKLQDIGFGIYLIDTGMESNTMNLVEWFKKQLHRVDFSEKTELNFFGMANKLVQSIAQKKVLEIKDLFVISQYQLDYLSPIIPFHFRRHFASGLKSGYFAFKICGSGGGGFMLSFVKNEKAFENYCSKNEIKTIKVSSL